MSITNLPWRRLAAPTALIVLLLASASAQAQSRALLLTEDFRTEITEGATALTEMLAAQGLVADQRNLFPFEDPGDLTPYQCVFDLRVDYDLDPIVAGRMQTLVEGGAGLYLAGEHAVFAPRNNSVTSFISIMGGGPVTTSPFSSGILTPRDIVEPMNPDHPLATDCNAVSEVVYDGIENGQFTSVGNGTWVSGTPTSAGMAAWGEGQLVLAPAARLVAGLDINWLATGPAGTLDFRVTDRTIPTQNRPLAENLVQWLCVPGASCVTTCEPRNHGFWHRACLGWDAIDPGRNGGGNGPGPSPQTEDFDASLAGAVDGAMAGYGVGSCQALDEGPFSDERMAALRELATLQFNVKGKLLALSCPVELEPVMEGDSLRVSDALAAMQMLLSLGDEESAKDARWIGEHVNNGEALVRR